MSDDMELKRAMDALPREIEPPLDLWPGVRGRLRTGRGAWGVGRGTDVRLLRIAALLALLAGSAMALGVVRHNESRWRVAQGNAKRIMLPGDSLTTASDVAHVRVGTIGLLDVDSGTSLRLLQSGVTRQHVRLTRGTIRARILAPPRVFTVETPSGLATDLGCSYILSVDSAGASRLQVTLGWVEFSDRGRISLVPAGFSVITSKAGGVGTPVANDAPPEFASAVHALDRYEMSNDSALGIILRTARPSDAVTLWHILSAWRGSAAQRERVYDRLARIVPPPVDERHATFAAVYGDPMTMKVWWTKLPGTLPILPEWETTLWKLWLKATG